MNRPVYSQALPGLICDPFTIVDLFAVCPRAERVDQAIPPYLAAPRPLLVDMHQFPGNQPQHYIPANAATDGTLLDAQNAVAELDAWGLIVTRIEVFVRRVAEATLHLNRSPSPEHLAAHASCLHTVRLAGRTVERCMAHGVWLEWEVVS